MSGCLTRLCFGPLAALASLIALGVWAVASQLPPGRAGESLLPGHYAMDFVRDIELTPMPGHPDAKIVETFLRRRDYDGPFFGWSDAEIERYDRSRINIGRFRVTPGSELQIVLALADNDYCPWFFGCPGVVLSKQNDEWVILTTFRSPSGVHFTIATRPFWARPSLDPSTGGSQELEYGRRILIQPAKAGRPTLVGPTSAIFWDGTEWRVGCWQLCEHR